MIRTLTLLCLLLTGNVSAAEDLRVESPWIREAPPGVMMLAGYLALYNQGEGPVVLEGVSSGLFRSVSIHRTVIEDGVSRMRPAGLLEIGPGEQLELEPGGLHIMLMGPERALKSGDEVTLQLQFRDRPPLEVQFPVRRP